LETIPNSDFPYAFNVTHSKIEFIDDRGLLPSGNLGKNATAVVVSIDIKKKIENTPEN